MKARRLRRNVCRYLIVHAHEASASTSRAWSDRTVVTYPNGLILDIPDGLHFEHIYIDHDEDEGELTVHGRWARRVRQALIAAGKMDAPTDWRTRWL